MLKGRIMCLRFDDPELDDIDIDNGIRQGDPLLVVLYQYYNTNLLDVPTSPLEHTAVYVDDTILIAMAKTFKDTHRMLVDVMTREGGALQWAREHNSKFELSKLALMDFAQQCKKISRPPLQIADTVVRQRCRVQVL